MFFHQYMIQLIPYNSLSITVPGLFLLYCCADKNGTPANHLPGVVCPKSQLCDDVSWEVRSGRKVQLLPVFIIDLGEVLVRHLVGNKIQSGRLPLKQAKETNGYEKMEQAVMTEMQNHNHQVRRIRIESNLWIPVLVKEDGSAALHSKPMSR